jgi:hypothetical protein
MALVLLCRSSRVNAATGIYPLLSAYIYNFTQLTTWPSGAIGDDFTVCVAGDDPFGSVLNPIGDKTVNGKDITIKRYDRDDDLSGCAVLFIAESEKNNLKTILAPLRKAPVLTMSNIEGFSNKGGMVEFKRESNKVGIWINLPAVKTAGISISSKLLSLARVKG